MGKKGKLTRGKRKLTKNAQFSAFVKNKWDGKEPYEAFTKREFIAWNNLPSKFKNPHTKV